MLQGQPATICDLFRDLRSFNSRGVQLRAELFLDKDQTATAANCDEDFVDESLVWATVLHLDPGPGLAERDRLALEHAREESIKSRRLNKHIRVTAVLEGTVETKEKYFWSNGFAEATGNAYGVHGRFPARILLTGVPEIHVDVLPDAEDLPVIDICEIFSDLTAYNGKRIAIRGEITGGYHGAAIYGTDCKKRFETDGFRWPAALYLGIPFRDSRFIQPLEGDRKRSARTDAEASNMIRGRRNVRAVYTAVGTVHTREHYHVVCTDSHTMFGNGFGEMGFAPAEFFEETSLDPAVEPRLPSDEEKETHQCASPKWLPNTDCSRLDLVNAAGGGCLDRIRALAAIRPLDDGNPALLRAVSAGFTDIVSVLVEAGVSVNMSWNDQLPLCEAIMSGQTPVVKALLEAGAKVNNSPESTCSLLGAVSRGDPEMIELLARNGANLELRDYFGCTPLMIAATYGKAANFHALLKAGADINAKDRDGGTPLTHGASSHRGIIQTLLKRGAFVDAADRDGKTALMYAAWESRDDIVGLLLEAGATVNMRDVQGDTALHMAALSGNSDAIPVLIQFGADPGLRNDGGERPVDLAHGYSRQAFQLKP